MVEVGATRTIAQTFLVYLVASWWQISITCFLCICFVHTCMCDFLHQASICPEQFLFVPQSVVAANLQLPLIPSYQLNLRTRLNLIWDTGYLGHS
jgi:hypothetical protein